ncbi:hypothetical protein SHELI_v1c05130 [Spiroplasma helicoides]|uniref:Uncharacterized protein n=1 Tax=Spiroplasma helicoides TaxID=216938 RepID=A0A1B3SKJ6_9MOLU|nr:hypothetical protein [Spiroplasma helicoides]AOG60464.1 hypothetical protein SHELI_v1c05130 [Spiroplasma helicoides]
MALEIRNLLIDSEDIKDFKDYCDLRGLKTYLYIANILKEITQKEFINYKEVRSIIIYDKRIKNILYRFFANIEDSLKALILDHYVIKNKKYVKNYDLNDFSVFEKFNIIKKGENKDSWSHILYIIFKNKILEANKKDELYELKDFRNKVMHFNFVLLEELNSGEYNFAWLNDNLHLFLKFLPQKFHDSFKTKINNAKNDLEIQKEFKIDHL